MHTQTNYPTTTYEYVYHGKVRDTMRLSDDKLAIVASDRISAFDFILSTGIPGKGIILTQLSNWWFGHLKDIAPNHLIHQLDFDGDFEKYPGLKEKASALKGRAIIAKKLKMLPIEWIVRGNLTGSGWKDYQKNGHVGGHKLPANLKMSEELPQPILTPSTKAEQGLHDENITCAKAGEILGKLGYGDYVYRKCEAYSLDIFDAAREIADKNGLILVDTKFEFGLDEKGDVILADEVLTPDSSRVWGKRQFHQAFKAGTDPESFDKQYVRNYLNELVKDGKWDKKSLPAPPLPNKVVRQTVDKYLSCYERITGGGNRLIADLREQWSR
ncbi:MAG: phosphoribosylaminoimidazolesuccinocarboxamide synthase [Rickettsiales bacterium]|jgi:phosphoribosylaminoimidazole-succinocarboxamide synthase|nr:phosphoribosylaminoimidazolesuccinocarboxamide synthase [Rickettsiales bacterium]